MRLRNMDSQTLLIEARKHSKTSVSEFDLKVAIVPSKSTQFIASALVYGFHKLGINVDILETGYNSIHYALMNPQSSFYEFKPDFCLILPDTRDISLYPKSGCTLDERESLIDKEYNTWLSMWQQIRTHCPNTLILQANYVVDTQRQFGQIEMSNPNSQACFVTRLNQRLYQNPYSVHFVDFDYIASYLGKQQWFDRSQYYLSKLPFSLDCLPYVTNEIIEKYQSLVQPQKKVLVLDLDNTLWGGVIGDVGKDGIDLDPASASGEAFLDFQRYIASLYERGVILAICSKNDESVAKSGFENRNMVLTLDMISAFEANWQPKSDNLLKIAEALNLGLDSFVFIDDNPFERNQVRQFLPQVTVLEISEDPSTYTDALDQALLFNPSSLTQEDLNRNASYKTLATLEALKTDTNSYEKYLESLEMTLYCDINNIQTIPRFTQLTNKSNQFNLCTQRYTETQIQEIMCTEDSYCMAFELSDNTVNYGIIACVIMHSSNEVMTIDNWVMSCRVLKRDVEFEIMNEIVSLAKRCGCTMIKGKYIQSQRNDMVSDLYPSLDFIRQDTDYVLAIDRYTYRETKIRKGERHG